MLALIRVPDPVTATAPALGVVVKEAKFTFPLLIDIVESEVNVALGDVTTPPITLTADEEETVTDTVNNTVPPETANVDDPVTKRVVPVRVPDEIEVVDAPLTTTA